MADGKTRVEAPRGMLNPAESDRLAGLQVRPSHIEFATQDPDEEIYILTRKDILTNIGWVTQIFIFALLPVIATILLNQMDVDLTPVIPLNIIILISLIYYSILISMTLFNIIRWYFNVFIVTNKRLINYKFNIITRFKASEAELRNIQDVSQSVVGFLPTVFNYGNLLIQTAAERNKFYIERVPRPTWLRDVIVDLVRLTREERL